MINYYNTRDLDLSHLDEDFATRVPATKLILNEVLSAAEYHRFKSLRKHAKSLGFKYVWHTDGNFLARWNRSSRAHFFNSLTDIDSIKLQHNYKNETMTDSGEKTDVTTRCLDKDIKKGTMKVGFVNATSLKWHIHSFREFLTNDPSFDVMGVAESRLGNVFDDHIVSIDGYSTLRQDRNT